LKKRVKTLEEELEKSKVEFEKLEKHCKNSSHMCDSLVCENCENLEKKAHYLVSTVDKLSKGKSNFENVLTSQNCVFGRAGLKYVRFLEMKGNIYPDLIRVFYTNLKFEGNNLVSRVKGVDMEITHDVWVTVTGLKYAGLRINK